MWKVLQAEAQAYLQTKLNILSYRHVAIAISRVHLKSGGFKRDYSGTEAAAMFDKQASYRSWTTGTVYARGLQEAPGHVKARWRQYQGISREWHGFLGFKTYLGPRGKQPLREEAPEGQIAKRQCIIIKIDQD